MVSPCSQNSLSRPVLSLGQRVPADVAAVAAVVVAAAATVEALILSLLLSQKTKSGRLHATKRTRIRALGAPRGREDSLNDHSAPEHRSKKEV